MNSIYNSLDTLPVVTFFKVMETSDYSLLNPNKEKITEEELMKVWEDLYNEFQDRDDNQANKKVFRITKELQVLSLKYNIIQMCIDALLFDYNEEAIKILKQHGYRVKKESYNSDLEKAQRYSKGILAQIELLKQQLPKLPEKEDNSNINDVLAGFATKVAVGKHNEVTCSEYLSYKKLISKIIQQQEEEVRKLKQKKNGK